MSDMGMKITLEQNAEASSSRADAVNSRFSGTGIVAEVVAHRDGVEGNRGRAGYSFIRIQTPSQHWVALAKWLKYEQEVNYCSMITGTHFPDGDDDHGWDVVTHLMRLPVRNVEPHTAEIHVAEKLKGTDVTIEYEVIITLPQGDSPTVPSVQSVWAGANWNEKETWDLVGIRFSGHKDMFRVLNPLDSPVDFHPLQKQHRLRYSGFNEMYDDPQGFLRKPTDEGRIK